MNVIAENTMPICFHKYSYIKKWAALCLYMSCKISQMRKKLKVAWEFSATEANVLCKYTSMIFVIYY